MMQVKFKKGRIPFEKLQEMLESGLEGEEFELPEVLCSTGTSRPSALLQTPASGS